MPSATTTRWLPLHMSTESNAKRNSRDIMFIHHPEERTGSRQGHLVKEAGQVVAHGDLLQCGEGVEHNVRGSELLVNAGADAGVIIAPHALSMWTRRDDDSLCRGGCHRGRR